MSDSSSKRRVGLDAGLFGHFETLESGGRKLGVARAALRFVRQLGSPRLVVEHAGGRLEARAPLVSVANGPYVGAAYALAPDARIDDGLLDVVVFRDSSVLRVLIHLVFVAGGRPLPPPRAFANPARTVGADCQEAGAAAPGARGR